LFRTFCSVTKSQKTVFRNQDFEVRLWGSTAIFVETFLSNVSAVSA